MPTVNKKLQTNMFPYFCAVDIIIREFVIFVIFSQPKPKKTQSCILENALLLKEVIKLTALNSSWCAIDNCVPKPKYKLNQGHI
jgi:hypothetical protein